MKPESIRNALYIGTITSLVVFLMTITLQAPLVTREVPLLAAQSTPITPIYSYFDPEVITLDQQEPVGFFAKITGSPSRVQLRFNQPLSEPELALHDDGLGIDAVAGDGVYSVLIPADQLTFSLEERDVFRPFVGFLDLYVGEATIGNGNIFAQILTDDIPIYSITQLADDVQYSDYLVNINMPNLFGDPGFMNELIPQVTQRFYQLFGDDYDFINIVLSPSHFSNRFHFQVQNNVQGIGLDLFDKSFEYGSFGRLLGITIFPNTSFFDGASDSYQHELAHQWINYLRGTPYESGIPHWPLSSLASGMMGWSIPPTGQGGDFACLLIPEDGQIRLVRRDEAPVFTDMDLYLMGLIPADQVETHYIFPDQSLDAFNEYSRSCDGSIYEGPLIEVEIEDVTSVHGPRVPAWAEALHEFKVATILVSRDGLLDEDSMRFYSYFSSRAELMEIVPYRDGFVQELAKPFFISTRGLGMLDASISPLQ